MAMPRVFVSMGTPYTEAHTNFRNEFENLLRDVCKVDPRIIGKNEYPVGNPLPHIREVMSKCQGVVIVAYERKFLDSGIEKRGGASEKKINGRAYTTPWNHIESSMAYSMGIPIYILCQHGLAEEGLIETKIDWYVQYVDISADGLKKTEVIASLDEWVKKRVIPFGGTSRSIKAMQGSMKISEMTFLEIGKFIGMLVGAFLLGVAVATGLPKVIEALTK